MLKNSLEHRKNDIKNKNKNNNCIAQQTFIFISKVINKSLILTLMAHFNFSQHFEICFIKTLKKAIHSSSWSFLHKYFHFVLVIWFSKSNQELADWQNPKRLVFDADLLFVFVEFPFPSTWHPLPLFSTLHLPYSSFLQASLD